MHAPDAFILNQNYVEPINTRLIRPETHAQLAQFSITRAFNAGLGPKLEISTQLTPLLSVAASLGFNFQSEPVESLEAKGFRGKTFQRLSNE